MAAGKQLIKENSAYIDNLPDWAQELSVKYCSKTANLYFVHGNIRDFLPHHVTEYGHNFLFVKIRDYISEVLFGNQNIIVYYDKSGGISFCSSDMEKDYLETMHKYYPDVPAEDFLSRNPEEAFSYLERYFVLNFGKNLRIVLIIDYAETIIPADEIGNLDETDRYCLVTLNRWSHEPSFTREDISIIMLTENLTDLNPRLTASPSTIKVRIPLPEASVRVNFLEYLRQTEGILLTERGLSPERMGALTSGLNLLNLYQLVAESYQDDKPISLDYLATKKREIIENEAGGLLEFIDIDYDLSLVSGHDFVKKRFKFAAKALKAARTDVLPMGYLISGPIGTGKTFIVSAFAGEIGIPMVRLRNFRSQWQGATESNLEKVLNILRAMSPVAVMIDEADVVLGNRTSNDISGTSGRVFAQIANFMGNTAYRGKIIWFLITCRPDLIPVDLKRQGRAEEHLALFYPENDAERLDLFETLQRKLRIKLHEVNLNSVIKKIKFDVSGADIEAILVRAKMNATVEGRAMVIQKDLEETIADFVPPSYPYEIELQNLVAAIECTSKEMVPKKYQSMQRSAMSSEIFELKQLLGEK
ncbi:MULTISPECIES: ATP-binding protein [unclassified Treponema]|uniref:ATP-binding protein n=1 Tax=unclassified Treponema TaxID=2638727 RepID=UPI0020A45292|nr:MULTISPECIES: AAA family ATPase [unclassified Treponema]UTC67785.1 ATP-binding protein [Treponema sp. OMZ 789]UTC70510.1 ATP-binding protein [Treponema sp. OMZ 790]UTC73222.1 ATP-binding protein [Treponema sp. OMZ 791]